MRTQLLAPALLATALCGHAKAEDIDWKVLRQTEVQASSFLQSNWNKYSENYHPNYVADENPSTAWVEGVTGNGEGESIVLPTNPIKSARAVRLRIRNGYQKSEGLLLANAAPRDVRIAVLGAGREVSQLTTTLERKMGWQEVVVPLPAGAGMSAVSLQVNSVHPGSKYKDTCISDIVVEVDTDVPYRTAIEAARLQRLLAWTKDRKDTAAYFASLPTSYPFAATAFQRTMVQDGDDSTDEAMLRALDAEAAAASTAGGWWKRTAKEAPPKAPDALHMLAHMTPLFTPALLAWFETSEQYAKRTQEETEYSRTTTHTTNARLTFHESSPATPATVWFEVNWEGEERGYYRETTQTYVQSDAQGRPVVVFVRSDSIDELGPHLSLERYLIRWSDSGQVDRIERVRRTEHTETEMLPDDEGPIQFERKIYTPKS